MISYLKWYSITTRLYIALTYLLTYKYIIYMLLYINVCHIVASVRILQEQPILPFILTKQMPPKYPLNTLNKKTSFLAWYIFDFLEIPLPLTDTHAHFEGGRSKVSSFRDVGRGSSFAHFFRGRGTICTSLESRERLHVCSLHHCHLYHHRMLQPRWCGTSCLSSAFMSSLRTFSCLHLRRVLSLYSYNSDAHIDL